MPRWYLPVDDPKLEHRPYFNLHVPTCVRPFAHTLYTVWRKKSIVSITPLWRASQRVRLPRTVKIELTEI